MRAYTADMIPGGASPVINVSQYDNDYAVTVTLIEGAEIYTPPSGATIMVEGTKPDGNGFSYACTYQGNVVTVPIYTQMTAVAGRFPIELVVYQSGLRVGSCNITLAVERAPLDSDEIISDSDIPAIIALAQSQADAAASSAASAETAKTAAMGAAQDAIDAAQELQTAIQFNAALIHETVSGAVASFADGADNIPMQSIVAEITPVQDLNGQANPYPPGGGKNLAKITNSMIANADIGTSSYTITGLTFSFTKIDDYSISRMVVSGSPTARTTTILIGDLSTVMPAGTYILSGCPSGGASNKYRLTCWDNTASVTVANDYGSGATFELVKGHNVNCAIDFSSSMAGQTVSNLVFKPMIRPATVADDTYVPYSNICPISGRTGMTVTRAGKNLIRNLKVQGNASTVTLGQSVTTGRETYLPAGTWTFSYTSAKTCSIYYRDEAADAESRNIRWVNNAKSGTITLTEGTFIRVWAFLSSGISAEEIESFQIEAGSTATGYEPYNGTEIPITWETEAGTVYGGTLDVVSGVLTVDKYLLTCGETVTPTGGNYAYAENPNRWQIPLADNYVPDSDKMGESISDTFGYYDGGLSVMPENTFRFSAIQSGGYRLIQFKWADQPTDVADLKALLAENPIHFVVPLATPQTYQLTPTEVRTLLGVNNLWSDSGDVSVEYIADTKMYIDKKIAELQALVLEN